MSYDDPNREAVGVDPIWTGADDSSGAIDPGGFDPGDHTVAEVEAYLAKHPDESDAVLAAERDGKNRVSLVGEDDDED